MVSILCGSLLLTRLLSYHTETQNSHVLQHVGQIRRHMHGASIPFLSAHDAGASNAPVAGVVELKPVLRHIDMEPEFQNDLEALERAEVTSTPVKNHGIYRVILSGERPLWLVIYGMELSVKQADYALFSSFQFVCCKHL